MEICKTKKYLVVIFAICLLGLVSIAGCTSNSSNEASTSDEVAVCEHDWSIVYETVYHDAVTHIETMPAVYGEETTYHTVCNDCLEVIDGEAASHIKETGHAGYSTNVPITNEVLVSAAYDYEVVDTEAYSEVIATEAVCTYCGETRELDS